MDEDDVVFVDEEDSRPSLTAKDIAKTEETRPLMQLFERLISNDTKSNTVLTNAQIISILEKEYNMDVSTLHELEIEIYISIVKMFLKDWPEWDSFDRIINRLRKSGPMIKSILEEKYKHLKEYLLEMIKSTAPAAKEAVEKVKKDLLKTANPETSKTVLEIYATRKQLNKFILRKPMQNNSIFNLAPYKESILDPMIPHFSFASILNWYGVRLTIELKNFSYSRFTSHRLDHTLVNKTNGTKCLKKELDQSIHIKHVQNVIVVEYPIVEILSMLNQILNHYSDKLEYNMIKDILNVVKTDLNIDSLRLAIPGTYRSYSSYYPYVRKLYEDVKMDSRNHDFYIEEVVTPIQDWQIRKMIKSGFMVMPSLETWLKLECGECKQNFSGAEFLTRLRDHFRMYHMDEPDWTCTNCNKEFAMTDITDKGWRHTC